MECLAVINQKGGVGKTTTSVNLGVGLAQRGRRVLLIDLDPQAHLTTHLGLDAKAHGAGIYEVLTQNLPLESAIHRYSDNTSVVPAHIDLAAAETELVSVVGREVILRDLLAGAAWPFDLVLIDCPPSLGILTLNALSAATRVLIPLQAHFLALQGVGKLFETISLVAQRINRALRVAGVAICMYESGTKLSGEVIDDLQAFLDSSRGTTAPWREATILQTRIRRNVKLAECPSYGQSIFEYAPKSHGAIDYLEMADEVLVLLGQGPAAAGARKAATAEEAADETEIVPTAGRTADVEPPALEEKAAEVKKATDVGKAGNGKKAAREGKAPVQKAAAVDSRAVVEPGSTSKPSATPAQPSDAGPVTQMKTPRGKPRPVQPTPPQPEAAPSVVPNPRPPTPCRPAVSA